MATEGPLSTATWTNDASVGTTAWSNPTNAQASNDTRATAAMGGGGNTQILKGLGWGFSIPTGATINGIEVAIERNASNNSRAADNLVQLYQGGSLGGDNKAAAGTWTTADATANYGGAADLWGRSWTAEQINHATEFGIAIRAQNNHGSQAVTAGVDHVTITVTYSESSPQTITAATISSGHVLHAATITAGVATITAATIASGHTLYAGTLSVAGGGGYTHQHWFSTGAMLGGSPTYNPIWCYVSTNNGSTWEPTYTGWTGESAAQGLLFNARQINAIWQENDGTYPESFNPDTNTAAYIAQLETYRNLGMLAATVGLQGGSPGYSPGSGNSSAFNNDGTAALGGGTFTAPGTGTWWARLQDVIEAADALGMCVIVNILYFGQDHFTNDNAVREAVRQTCQFLLANDYRNTMIDVANEYDLFSRTLVSANANPNGIAELIEIAQDEFIGESWRPAVGSSHTQFSWTGAIAAVADMYLPHGNNLSVAQITTGLGGRPTDRPTIMNEDHPPNGGEYNGPGLVVTQTNLDRELDALAACVAADSSWGTMLFRYFQALVMRWTVGSSPDISGGSEENYVRAVYNGFYALTGDPPGETIIDSAYSNTDSATTQAGPTITAVAIPSGHTLHVGTVTVSFAGQTINAATIASGHVLHVGRVAEPIDSEYSNVDSATTLSAGDTINAVAIPSGHMLHTATLSAERVLSASTIASGHQLHVATLNASRAILGAAIASGHVLHEATVTAERSIAAAAISSGHVLHAGDVQPGGVTISAATIASGHALHVATISSGTVITAATIPSGHVLHAATVVPGVATIDAATISSGHALHAGTVTAGASPQTIPAASIASGHTLHEATVTPGTATISAAAIGSGHALHAGTVTAGPAPQIISAAAISSGHVLHAADVQPGIATIIAAAIASGHVLHAGAVLTAGAIGAAAIPSGHVLHLATITTGAVSIDAAEIPSGHVLHDATVTATRTIDAAAIPSGHTLHNGTVAADSGPQTISAANIPSGHTLHAATVAAGERTIAAATIAAGHVLHVATVSGVVTIDAAAISSGHTLHVGTVTPGAATIDGATIPSGHALHLATFVYGQSIEAAAIPSGHVLHLGVLAVQVLQSSGSATFEMVDPGGVSFEMLDIGGATFEMEDVGALVLELV